MTNKQRRKQSGSDQETTVSEEARSKGFMPRISSHVRGELTRPPASPHGTDLRKHHSSARRSFPSQRVRSPASACVPVGESYGAELLLSGKPEGGSCSSMRHIRTGQLHQEMEGKTVKTDTCIEK